MWDIVGYLEMAGSFGFPQVLELAQAACHSTATELEAERLQCFLSDDLHIMKHQHSEPWRSHFVVSLKMPEASKL